jgi:NADP-dependent 3-hydroxy acid dehydrogenase YdfG
VALAREGARVALGDLDIARARTAADGLGRDSVALELDVSDRRSFVRFLDRAEAELGPLDALVNNAGVMALGPFLEADDPTTRRQVDVNLHGVINGMQAVLPRMLLRGHGHIVNVASTAGKTGVPGEAVYVATKHAVVGLTEAVRGELRDTPIHLSMILPGPVATELAAGMSSTRGIRMIQPEQVAEAIVATLRAPRFEVYVPRSLGMVMRVSGVLPRRAREALERFFGVGLIATRIDWGKREAYAERTFGSLQPADETETTRERSSRV